MNEAPQHERILRLALDTPLHREFDYRWMGEVLPQIGQLALVSFGRREVVGLIVDIKTDTDVPADKLKNVVAVREQLSPLSVQWLDLCRFAADYYHRSLGEVALPALPKNCRISKTTALDKALKKITTRTILDATSHRTPAAKLNDAQKKAVQHITSAKGFLVTMLFGITGSGKTEVYLHAADHVLASDPNAQILLLVPEINLTPQLQKQLHARFPNTDVALLHSAMSEGERTAHWLSAHVGEARIVLGTRLAVLASLPSLKLIIIDEEHDASYKQQEGLRYSARDLAIWRAKQLDIPIVLGSATPSLESWQRAVSGKYQTLHLPSRAVASATLPAMHLIDLAKDKPQHGLSATLVAALEKRLAQGEQSLLFLNRRGYAPVLSCEACGWISHCERCSAFLVLHKPDQTLRCHHCSFETPIAKSCPTCGNIDLQPVGRGTQRIEEHLQTLFPDARIARIDADSTRLKGSAQAAFETVHRGEVDILIGTQMVAKGHDFKKLTLVGVINPDNALFTQDYRASEKLFAQLMQVSGRAGRAAQKLDGNPSEVFIQTRYPEHPLYQTLKRHDYPRFAKTCLAERRQAVLPPFVYQALLRAEAKDLKKALAFLKQAMTLCTDVSTAIVLHDPIPMSVVKVANVERAQLLIESSSRLALQTFLKSWLPQLRELKPSMSWSLEVDPLDI